MKTRQRMFEKMSHKRGFVVSYKQVLRPIKCFETFWPSVCHKNFNFRRCLLIVRMASKTVIRSNVISLFSPINCTKNAISNVFLHLQFVALENSHKRWAKRILLFSILKFITKIFLALLYLNT